MRLYLDDNSASRVLAQMLRKAGHDVQLPSEAGKSGADDAVHLAHAVREDRVCLTRDHGDYEDLHSLIVIARGHHPGILVIRQENNPRRDLRPRDIVRAIDNLQASKQALADQCQVLNHWR